MVKRMFLVEMNNKRSEKYEFAYNQASDLPAMNTRNIDFWGFWNGGDNSSANLIPTFTMTTEGDLTYTSTERDPSTTLHAASLLNKVTYPTGGWTEISYEPHDYSQRLERRADNLFIPKLYSVTGNAGGARVSKLIDASNTGTTETRNFIYQSGNGVSSGILLDWPRFVYMLKGSYDSGGSSQEVQITSHGFSINCTDDEYISYSCVSEQQANNGGTKTFFSTFQTNPDELQGQSTKISERLPADYIELEDFWQGFYRMPNSHKTERGKITRRVILNAKGDTTSVEKYSYAPVGNNYIPSILISGNQYASYRNYIHSPQLIKKIGMEYDQSGQNPVGTVETYNYNQNNQISDVNTTRSDNTTQTIKYTYPFEIVTGPDSEVLQQMADSNIYSPIVKSIVYLGDENDNRAIEAEYRKYKEFYPGIFKPERIDKLQVTTPVSISDIDNYMKPDLYYDYNSQGYIIESKPAGEASTVCLWGYNGQYPIAKIETRSPENVLSELNNAGIDIDNLASKPYPQMTILRKLNLSG